MCIFIIRTGARERVCWSLHTSPVWIFDPTTHWSSLTVREHGPRLISSILHFSCARKTMAVCWHHHTSGEEHKRSQKTWRKHKHSSAIWNVRKTQNCKLTKFCFCGLSDGWIYGCINPASGLLEKLKASLKPQIASIRNRNVPFAWHVVRCLPYLLLRHTCAQGPSTTLMSVFCLILQLPVEGHCTGCFMKQAQICRINCAWEAELLSLCN